MTDQTILRIGICGLGTVGAGAFNLVVDNADEISRRTGMQVVVSQVGCRRDNPDCDLTRVAVSRDIFEVVRNPEVDVVLELIGGTDTALELVLEAIRQGKHVVTANKALIAHHGAEIFALADQHGVQVRYEAAIAGGIPVVKAIREGLAANRIEWLAGIINGTSNYILTEMGKEGGNQDFAAVLADAQALGYAEADPTFDVEGIDAAHKLTILSSIAFGVPLRFDAVFTEGISTMTPADIQYAGELGYQIKHLGITRCSDEGIELRVHPALVANSELLAQVSGVMNAVLVGSDAAGATMYYGAGAGSGPTASSVIADVLDIARASELASPLGFVSDTIKSLPVLSINQVICSQYLRLDVHDVPGVLASISTILSNNGISIEALIQKEARQGAAAIVILTNEVGEEDVAAALAQISELPHVEQPVQRIRVVSFDS